MRRNYSKVAEHTAYIFVDVKRARNSNNILPRLFVFVLMLTTTTTTTTLSRIISEEKTNKHNKYKRIVIYILTKDKISSSEFIYLIADQKKSVF
jgi:hypothetical protein